MNKSLFLLILWMGASQLWGQGIPKDFNYNNPAEVIITLTEEINDIILLYDHAFKKNIWGKHELDITSMDPDEKNYSSYVKLTMLYELAMNIKPHVASMSHGERVYYLGVLYGMIEFLFV